MVNVLAALATVAVALLWRPQLGQQSRRTARADHGHVQQLLNEAGLDWPAGSYWAARVGIATLVLLLARSVTGTLAVALAPAVAAATLPKMWLLRRRMQRRAALQRAWPDGLRDLAASVSAGMSLTQAVAALAQSGPEALRPLFARVPVLLPAIGLPAALERVRAQAADPMTDRVIEVLLLAHERGGRMLPTLLADLAESASRDVHVQERITTAQLELRINARAVFVLPWLVLSVLTARPGPFRAYYASTGGLLVVIGAGLLSLLGMVIVERLGRLPLEPRIFRGTEQVS